MMIQMNQSHILAVACAFALIACDDDDNNQSDFDTEIVTDAESTTQDASLNEDATITDSAISEDGSTDPQDEGVENIDGTVDSSLEDSTIIEQDSDIPEDATVISNKLSGIIQFEKKAIEADPNLRTVFIAPARGIKVELINKATRIAVSTAYTDSTGHYEFRKKAEDLDADATYYVRASTLSNKKATTNVVVTPDEQDVYSIVSEDWQLEDGAFPEGIGDLTAGIEEGVAGAFNIIDVLYMWMQLQTRNSNKLTEDMTVYWEQGYELGTCYYANQIDIGGQLDDTDEFDDKIIAHEFGHHFIATVGYDDSPGGSHRDNFVSPNLAYGEGVAYFLAGLVYGDPLIVDTFSDGARIVDLENVTIQGSTLVTLDEIKGTTTGTVNGSQHEELVGGIQWDVYDDASNDEPFDTVAIGEHGSMEILVNVIGHHLPTPDQGALYMDLADWINAAMCMAPEAAGLEEAISPNAMNSILERFEYPWDASNAQCQNKFKIPSPVQFESQNNRLMLVLKPGATAMDAGEVTVHHQGTKATKLCSSYPCEVGPEGKGVNDVWIAVGHLNGERFSTSFVSAAARQKLKGNFRVAADGYREYRSL